MNNNKQTALNWYKKLSTHQRIGLKECSALICGLEWASFNLLLFSPRERIEILYEKLKLENII